MMGWRGTVRSIGAAVRAADREAQRQQKANLKAQLIADAEDAVADWEGHIANLISLHTDLADAIDWRAFAEQPLPVEPQLATKHQLQATEALQNFKPGMFGSFGRRAEKRRQILEQNLAKASDQDQEDYQTALESHLSALQDWESDTQLAHRLLSGEATAIREVIEESQCFSDQDFIGSTVSFHINDNYLHACPQVHSDEIIPSFKRKQLASGKLSETKMPIEEFNELYQDYVSSVALKIAGDLFRTVPLEEIYVSCLAMMLDKKTGHQKILPILSVQFIRETFSRLNLSRVDPSDSLKNFSHVMLFKRNKGFDSVEPLKPID